MGKNEKNNNNKLNYGNDKPESNTINEIHGNRIGKEAIFGWIISFVISLFTVFMSFRISSYGELKQGYGEYKVFKEASEKSFEAYKGDTEKNFDRIDDKLSLIDNKMEELNTQVNSAVVSMSNIQDEFELFSSMIERIVTKSNSSIIVYNTSNDGAYVDVSRPEWGENANDPDFVAITKCLANNRMVYSYTQHDDEVFFAGQYDENGQWDGQCLINVYNKGLLKLAIETEYNSGVATMSKQLFKTTDGIWMYAERVFITGEDIGDSWKYAYKADFEKIIDYDNPLEEYMYVPENTRDLLGEYTQWYHGKISNGLYNDNSGNSYMVSKYEDGSIKTIYMGGFKDGTFNDDSYEAWYVSRIRERNTRYNYYVGPFRNGGPALNGFAQGVYFDDAISRKELEYIIKDTPFANETGWIDSLFDQNTDMPNLD